MSTTIQRRNRFPSMPTQRSRQHFRTMMGLLGIVFFGTMCIVHLDAFVVSSTTTTTTIVQYHHHHHHRTNEKIMRMTKSDSSSSNIESNTTHEIPANLRRKVSARRPFLGHVVPSTSTTTKQRGGRQASKLKPQGQQQQDGTTTTKSSRIRVAGGIARGRKLDAPDVYLRPMMGKVKEAVYSTLTYLGVYDTTIAVRHVDIFAGSGSVGIESLSRGATGCIFVDLSDNCCQCIQHNLEQTGLLAEDTEDTKIIRADAMEFLKYPQQFGVRSTCQILTICPPYEEVVYGDLMEAAVSSPLVAESDTILIVEYPIELGSLPHVITATRNDDHNDRVHNTAVGIRNRRYGRTVIAMYIINPSGKLDRADSRPEEFVAV